MDTLYQIQINNEVPKAWNTNMKYSCIVRKTKQPNLHTQTKNRRRRKIRVWSCTSGFIANSKSSRSGHKRKVLVPYTMHSCIHQLWWNVWRITPSFTPPRGRGKCKHFQREANCAFIIHYSTRTYKIIMNHCIVKYCVWKAWQINLRRFKALRKLKN